MEQTGREESPLESSVDEAVGLGVLVGRAMFAVVEP
jgi:hypothetical protein